MQLEPHVGVRELQAESLESAWTSGHTFQLGQETGRKGIKGLDRGRSGGSRHSFLEEEGME